MRKKTGSFCQVADESRQPCVQFAAGVRRWLSPGVEREREEDSVTWFEIESKKIQSDDLVRWFE